MVDCYYVNNRNYVKMTQLFSILQKKKIMLGDVKKNKNGMQAGAGAGAGAGKLFSQMRGEGWGVKNTP